MRAMAKPSYRKARKRDMEKGCEEEVQGEEKIETRGSKLPPINKSPQNVRTQPSRLCSGERGPMEGRDEMMRKLDKK